jgi:ribonuclease Z
LHLKLFRDNLKVEKFKTKTNIYKHILVIRMEIITLGTSCMLPTKERNPSAMFMKFHGQGLLFDCGEGTQRQLKFAKIKITDVDKMFISHLHGDHVLGIPGFLQTLSSSEYTKKLIIYGPKGMKEFMSNLFKTFIFENTLDMEIIEIEKDGLLVDSKKYQIEAYKLEHSILTYGYRFIEKNTRKMNMAFIESKKIPFGPLLGKLQRGEDIEFKGEKITVQQATILVKGRKIGIVNDTVMCKGAYKIAENVNVLISECAYDSTLIEKAEKYKHMTAKQVAQLASQCNVEKLILTHFSCRYKTIEPILEEAKDIFENTICAYDLMRIKVK